MSSRSSHEVEITTDLLLQKVQELALRIVELELLRDALIARLEKQDEQTKPDPS